MSFTSTHNPTLDEILKSQQVIDAEGNALPLHSHLPPEEGEVLQHWVGKFQPRRLLEIGLAYGLSSLYISDAIADWPPQCYHIIDPFQEQQWNGIGKRNLQQAGFWPGITHFSQRSEFCLPQLLEADNRYDFAFIDGWHTFDQVMTEFYYINRMMEVGGIIVFDDVHLPALQKLLGYLLNYPCYKSLDLPDRVGNSLAAKVRKTAGLPPVRIAGILKTDKDTRDWDWFEDFQ